jgi:hypothetical protein
MFIKLNTLISDHENVLKKASAAKSKNPRRKALEPQEEEDQLLNLAEIILTEIQKEEGEEEE